MTAATESADLQLIFYSHYPAEVAAASSQFAVSCTIEDESETNWVQILSLSADLDIVEESAETIAGLENENKSIISIQDSYYDDDNDGADTMLSPHQNNLATRFSYLLHCRRHSHSQNQTPYSQTSRVPCRRH